ncbi:MAG TPA: hypothetical protein VMN57_15045, partial [Anaerolineales bacterium]|nr:hypothetical protein [Anaerolineales bacterium]
MTDQTDFFEHLDLTEPGAAEALINAYAQPVAHLLTSLDLVSEGELEDALIGLFAAVVATQDRFDPSIDPSIVSWFYRQAIPNLLGFADRRDRKELARRLPALLAAPPHNLTETEIGIVLNLREQTVAKQIREVSVLHDSRDKLQGWDLGPDSISAAVTARLAANATEKQAGENGRRIAWKEAGLAVLAAGVVLVLIFLFLRSDQSERGVDLFQEEPNLPDPITTVSSEVRRTGSGGSPDAEFRLSTYPILSDNGRYLLFTSNQPDLVADDGNDAYDIFVRETATGVIHRVSLGPGGVELFGESFSGAISADGSRVVFITEQATVGGKVTVRDWQTGESRIISGEPDRQGYPSFIAPGISGDGNIIVYWGVSPNPDICGSGESFPHVCYDLVVYEYSSETFHQIPFGKPHFDFFQTTRLTFDGDLLALTLNEGDLPWSRLGSTNRAEAVLYDWRQDRITLLNTAPDGTIGNRPSSNPVISTDGTKAVFLSLADNETASGDGDDDVLVLFYTDREAGVLRQIRPPSIERGPELNPGESALYLGFDLSPDGRYVIFADLFTTPEFFDLGSRHCGLLFGEWRCLNSLLYDAVEDTFQQLPVEPIMASLPEVHLLYWPSISQNAEFIAFQAGGWELQPPCPMEGCMSVWLLSPEAGSADLASRPTAPVSGLGSTPQWTLSGGIPGPSGWVNAVAFSPGGRLIASGRADGSIQIADLAGVEEPYILGKLPDDISSLAFSPQGLRLAAGSHDGTVTIWDLETRSLAATLHGHPGLVLSVAFSPDGSSIAVGTQQSLWTWTDSATGFFQSGGFTQKNVQAIDFSPGGAHLAAVSDNEVWIRNIATG